MNFDLSEDQETLAETVDRLFTNKLPLAAVREHFDADAPGLDAPWHALADLGLFAIGVPEADGGAGGDLLDLAVVAERLGYASAPGPFLEHVLATVAIVAGGSAEQRQRWVPGLADGSRRATIALGNAPLAGDRRLVLHPAGADLVVAGTPDGLSLIAGDADGLSVEPVQVIDRTRRLATLCFDDVAEEPLPGGLEAARRVLDTGLVLLAADASGGALRCVEMAVEYAKSREQFGVTIGHFQALKHQLADMALEVEPARYLYWYAAHAVDHEPDHASKFAALAKAHLTERYEQAGRRAVECHGGIGYTWECDVHLFLKRAVFDRTYLGGPALHRSRVAAMNGWMSEAPLDTAR
jgi:alkylation response protein AidB-like acyl-CoA dehydrogenase